MFLGLSQYLQKEAACSEFDIFFNTAGRSLALRQQFMVRAQKCSKECVKKQEIRFKAGSCCSLLGNILPIKSCGHSSSFWLSLPSYRSSGKPAWVSQLAGSLLAGLMAHAPAVCSRVGETCWEALPCSAQPIRCVVLRRNVS